MTQCFKQRIGFLLRFSIYICFLSAIIISCGTTAQSTSGYTSYESYAVKKGETVRSIARERNIPESVIYNLNPDSRKGIKTNSILILPSTPSGTSKPEKAVIAHEVKKQETLYGLSKKYNVSEETIKSYNKALKERDLRIGEIIYIPTGIVENMKNPAIELPPGIEEYEIQPKDTKYSIAKNHGITVDALEALNPKMGETLEIGYKILVPDAAPKKGEELDTENFEYYEVQPKEGFFRLKQKFDLTEKEIIAHNPQAKDGLQEGMILKLPKPGKDNEDDFESTDLETTIRYKDTKNIALMLPFGLQNSDPESEKENEELLKNDATLRIALDFYSGAMMAAEFAKELGISVSFNVYDTEKNEATVAKIVSQSDFDKNDVVIGPLLQRNIERTTMLLAKKKTPVFSPLSNRQMAQYPNYFQTLPTGNTLESKMITYIKENSDNKNIIVIHDAKHQAQKQKIVEAIPSARSLSITGSYAEREQIEQMLNKNEEADNWIIVVSDKAILVGSIVNILGDLSNESSIRLFALDKNDAFEWEEVSNTQLAKLDFTFPSVNKTFTDSEAPFVLRYKEKHGVLPNRYVIRGFDITYDIILRMASAKDPYKAFDTPLETTYIENKFRYINTKNGYQNQAAYILKYNDKLNFEVVE